MHSDKKPKLKDDVTGLAAFDDLDPVSAVSELNLFLEPQAAQMPTAQPQLGSRVNTLPPARFAPSAPPPPVPQQAAPPVQPEAYSTPTSAPAHPASPDSYDFDDDEEQTGYYDRPAEGSQPGQASQSGQAGQAGHPGAALSMEWEEEELETRLRPGDTIDHAAGAPFTAVAGGNPSPFPSDSPVIGEQAQQYSQPVPSAAPAMLPAEPVADEEWPEEKRGGSKIAIAGVILALAVVAQLVVWQMGSSEPGVATLVTTPAGASVTVDGVAATTSHSPFILELTPDEEHEIVITHKGYASQTLPVSIEAGDRLELPAIDLVSEAGTTGFALSSAPAGATVFIDGADTGKKTPFEFTDVDPGMHTIRLEAEAGARVFELQVFVVEDKVLELPEATLTEVKGKANAEQPIDKASDVVAHNGAKGGAQAQAQDGAKKSRTARASRSKVRRTRGAISSSRAGVAPAKRTSAKKFSAKKKASTKRSRAVAASAGGMGTLRINTRPWSAITVDGKKVGNTPQLNLQLSAGTHKIRLTNPQMGLSKTIRVKIKKGQTTTKILNLIE